MTTFGSTNDESPRTFGDRSYDPVACAHGCCLLAVCEWIGDCDRHNTPASEQELADLYASYGSQR